MYPTTFTTLVLIFFTLLTKGTHASKPKPAADASHWVNGDFESSLKTGWYYTHTGARFTRILHKGAGPKSPRNNHVLKLGQIHCHLEQYRAIAFGTVIRTLPGKRYKLSFDYLFQHSTDRVSWLVQYYAANKDPALVHYTQNHTYSHTAKAGRWHRWTGELKKPDGIGHANMQVAVDFNTCDPNFKGFILVDEFQIHEI